MVDKITTVPKSKLGVRVGRLDDDDMVRFNRAMAVFLGLAVSTKWFALFAFAGQLIIILFIYLRKSRGDSFRLVLDKLRTAFLTGFRVLGIMAAVYLATYLPRFVAGFTLRGFFDEQISMFLYHTELTATHPFASPWYTWPLMLRPLWLYVSQQSSSVVSTIVLMGNPVVWWLALPVIIFVILRISKRLDSGYYVLLVAYFSQLLPFALLTRPLFIYHYYSEVPIICALMGALLGKAWEDHVEIRPLIVGVLFAACVLFVVFYPVISGYPTTIGYEGSLRWLSSWTF